MKLCALERERERGRDRSKNLRALECQKKFILALVLNYFALVSEAFTHRPRLKLPIIQTAKIKITVFSHVFKPTIYIYYVSPGAS